MALLNILRYPDARLHKLAAPITVFDEPLKRLVADMAETMYAAPGIGLAAIQVGVPRRVIVMDIAVEGETPQPLQFVNPELLWASEEIKPAEEGCLSLPDMYDIVERPAQARVKFLDYHGQEQEILAEGMLAVCLQHEMDHLEGILFVDHISRLKRDIILRKLIKAKRLALTD
jgi:peptide deformylase